MADLLLRRVVAALITLPNTGDWRLTVVLLALLAVAARLVGRATGFFRPGLPAGISAGRLAGIALGAFAFPALAEEIVFRALLLPHPAVGDDGTAWQQRWLWAALGLALFVAAHPARARWLSPGRRAVFTDPVFLLLATLLGAACTVAYLCSGSVRPPTLLHGLAVAVWLLGLGGYDRLRDPDGLEKKRH